MSPLGNPAHDLWSNLVGQKLAVHVTGQPNVSGTLISSAKYEVLIQTSAGGRVLIPKGSIANDYICTQRSDAAEVDDGQ